MKFDVFLIPLSITFLNPKILGFLFSMKNGLTWEVNAKIKLQKSVRNLLDIKPSKIVHEWHGHPEIFSRPQVIENFKQYLLLPTNILQKKVVRCP